MEMQFKAVRHFLADHLILTLTKHSFFIFMSNRTAASAIWMRVSQCIENVVSAL